MDIAIISSANGGVGNFTYNISKHLSEYVDRIDLYMYKDPDREVPAGDLPENVNVAMESSSRILFALKLIYVTPKMTGYDILHTIILSPYILLMEVLGGGSVRTVITMHPQPVGSIEEWNLKSMLNIIFHKCEKLMQPKLASISDAVVTVSEDSSELLFDKWRVDAQVIHHGVDATKFAPESGQEREIREHLGVGEDELLFLFVGILYPEKDVKTLIEAIPEVVRAHNDCHFLIIGRGPEQNSTIKRIQKSGHDEFITQIDYVENIEDYYSTADIFVSPSYIEDFGIVYIEAMQSGLPVIAADIPVAREVVDGAGIFFEPKNPDDLSEKVIELIEDQTKAEKLEAIALDRADDFTWESAAQDYLNIYRSTLP